MTTIFDLATGDEWAQLPSGVMILASHPYTVPELIAVTAVSVASGLSILAITILFIALAVSLFRLSDHKVMNGQTFIRSQPGVYFICMMISTFLFTSGFSMNMVWAYRGKIEFGTFCNIQAALKQFGNVAAAFFCLAIAVHTFCVVFLASKVPNYVCYIVVPVIWLITAAIVAVGPLFFANDAMGPWYGISAQWCWTSDNYVLPRFATEYLWICLTAAACTILYVLLFLKLRGNIVDGKFHFKAQPVGPETTKVARQMLWYPLAYALLVFPIAGCRMFEITNRQMANFEFKMTSAVLFMLSGLVDVIIFTITRNILHVRALLPSVFGRHHDLESAMTSRTSTYYGDEKHPDDMEKHISPFSSSVMNQTIIVKPPTRSASLGGAKGERDSGRYSYYSIASTLRSNSPYQGRHLLARPESDGTLRMQSPISPMDSPANSRYVTPVDTIRRSSPIFERNADLQRSLSNSSGRFGSEQGGSRPATPSSSVSGGPKNPPRAVLKKPRRPDDDFDF